MLIVSMKMTESNTQPGCKQMAKSENAENLRDEKIWEKARRDKKNGYLIMLKSTEQTRSQVHVTK